MKYTKEEVERLQDIYNKNLAGTYLPDDLQWAYFLLTGNEQPVAVRTKKQTLYAFINYEMKKENDPNLGRTVYVEEPEEKNGAESHSPTDNPTDPMEVKNEKVITSKPKAKKKRVYKRKNIKIEKDGK